MSWNGLEGEGVFAGFGFGGDAEGGKDGLAFIPIRKLVSVMTAAELAGFASGHELDGAVPIGKIGDKAHRWTMVRRCGARAVASAGLRQVREAENALK